MVAAPAVNGMKKDSSAGVLKRRVSSETRLWAGLFRGEVWGVLRVPNRLEVTDSTPSASTAMFCKQYPGLDNGSGKTKRAVCRTCSTNKIA